MANMGRGELETGDFCGRWLADPQRLKNQGYKILWNDIEFHKIIILIIFTKFIYNNNLIEKKIKLIPVHLLLQIFTN